MQKLKVLCLFLPFVSNFHVFGNEVTPFSNCSSLCLLRPGDDIASSKASRFNEKDVVCNDWELDGPNSTAVGRRFVNCTKCLSTSVAQISDSQFENDPYWFVCSLPLLMKSKVKSTDSSLA